MIKSTIISKIYNYKKRIIEPKRKIKRYQEQQIFLAISLPNKVRILDLFIFPQKLTMSYNRRSQTTINQGSCLGNSDSNELILFQNQRDEQLAEFIAICLSKSTLNKRVGSLEAQLSEANQRFEKFKSDQFLFQTSVHSQFDKFALKTSAIDRKIDGNRADANKMFDEVQDSMDELQDQNSAQQVQIDSLLESIADNSRQHLQFREKQHKHEDEIDKHHETIESNYKELSDRMSTNIEEMSKFLRDQNALTIGVTDHKMDQIQTALKSELGLVRGAFEELKGDLIQKYGKADNAIRKKIQNVKDVCSKYFDEIDKMHSKNMSTVEHIKETYDSFKKVVFDPHNQNDSRIFALETRFKEVERERMAEFYYLKEILNSLVREVEDTSKVNHQSVFNAATYNESLSALAHQIGEPQHKNNFNMTNTESNLPSIQGSPPREMSLAGTSITKPGFFQSTKQSIEQQIKQQSTQESSRDSSGPSTKIKLLKFALSKETEIIQQLKRTFHPVEKIQTELLPGQNYLDISSDIKQTPDELKVDVSAFLDKEQRISKNKIEIKVTKLAELKSKHMSNKGRSPSVTKQLDFLKVSELGHKTLGPNGFRSTRVRDINNKYIEILQRQQ